jgi:hypothetical protein
LGLLAIEDVCASCRIRVKAVALNHIDVWGWTRFFIKPCRIRLYVPKNPWNIRDIFYNFGSLGF